MSRFSGALVAFVSVCVAVLFQQSGQGQVVPLSNFGDHGRSVQRSRIAEFDGSIYFGVAIDDTNDRELWRYNGAGTELVEAGFVGFTELAIDEFTEFQGQLYFSANRDGSGHELYRFDGQTVTLAADIATGSDSSHPVGLFVHNDELFFSAKQGYSYNNLWKFDGTQATPVASFSDPRASVVTGASFQGELYFGADHDGTGMELWKYDGEEVSQVAEINPGPADSYPRDFTVVGDTLYFKATTRELGQEVWRYDGETVQNFQDVNPGSLSSDPRHFTNVDGTFMFSAVSWAQRSVWAFDGSQSQQVINGGGPIQMGDEFLTIRGRHVNNVEINDLYWLNGDFFRSTVPSAGPFESMDGNLFFSCSCSERELFMVAPAGDANMDGAVDFDDFLTLSKNFGKDEGGWNAGDFDRDGIVAFPDFLLQSNNFGEKAMANGFSAVPEPATPVYLICIALALLAWRRQPTY